MRFMPVVLSLALASGAVLAQQGGYVPPTGENGKPVIDAAEWESLKTILPRAFAALAPNEGPSGKKALKSIRQNLGMSDAAAEETARQIDEVMKVTGAYTSFDLLGIQALHRGERFYRLGYLTYGPRGPALWEATAYRAEPGWKLLEISVSTDKIFDKGQAYR